MNSSNIKKKKATHILEDLDVQEVSLVSSPAIGRKYLLTKSADSVMNNRKDRLQEKADQIQAAGNVTKEQAFAQACEENPKLWLEYDRSQKSAVVESYDEMEGVRRQRIAEHLGDKILACQDDGQALRDLRKRYSRQFEVLGL